MFHSGYYDWEISLPLEVYTIYPLKNKERKKKLSSNKKIYISQAIQIYESNTVKYTGIK